MRIKEWQYEKFGLSRELVSETVETVLRHADPSRIILYGSRSRGDFAERSDIDLAIEGVSHPGLLRGYLEEEVRTLRRFDVIDLDRTTSTMRESVERDGIILYEKEDSSSREF